MSEIFNMAAEGDKEVSTLERIKKTIRHCESVKKGAMVVLDSGFGTNKGESDIVYRNRKMYAETAIEAMEKQLPKKPEKKDDSTGLKERYFCPSCGRYLGQKGKHNVIIFNKETYCQGEGCGQAIDWSDEE